VLERRFFESANGVTAYRRLEGDSRCGVFYLPGHTSDPDAEKGRFIEDLCVREGISLLHFIFYGWDASESSAVPKEGRGYIRHWLTQALEVFDALTEGPQVVVGSSMGGYLALALAAARPERVVGVVGLAAGFGSGLCEKAAALYGTYDVVDLEGRGFAVAADSEKTLAIEGVLDVRGPVRLYHSMKDSVVSWKNVFEVSKAVVTEDVGIALAKDGHHGLNFVEDLAWLERILTGLAR
jgi:pimeloyl-ACP methyl ester carboxylesterase